MRPSGRPVLGLDIGGRPAVAVDPAAAATRVQLAARGDVVGVVRAATVAFDMLDPVGPHRHPARPETEDAHA